MLYDLASSDCSTPETRTLGRAGKQRIINLESAFTRPSLTSDDEDMYADVNKTRKKTIIATFSANVNSRSRSLHAIARPSVVCLSPATLVRPTQAVQIFGNISTALGTLAIRGHPLKILRRSSQGNPSAGGVEHKRGSKI